MPFESQHDINPVVIFAWKVAKLQRKFVSAAAPEYNLTQNEKDVLLFLYNNKTLDTAGDIVKYRSISKSLVAKSVKSLSDRGFLQQRQDEKDGRYVHLEILPAAEDAVKKLRKSQKECQAAISNDLTPEQQQELKKLLEIITKTMDKYL